MKTRKLFAAAAIMLAAVACQVIDEGQAVKSQLKVTATIAEDEASKVDYTIDNDNNIISPTWHNGDTPDQIIGFDNLGRTFTFTVNDVTNERKNAKFDLGGYELTEGVNKLYAIYAPGVEASSIDNKTLEIDLSAQGGVLDGSAPVLMCATAEIVNDQVNFVFENKTAIIGVKKFQLNKSTTSHTVTSMTLNGVVTEGTFSIDGESDKLTLTPTGSAASITATHPKGGWTTTDEGIFDGGVYFAAMPNSTSATLSLDATTSDGNNYINVNAINPTALNAGQYYYMSKKLGEPEASVTIGDVTTKYMTIDAAFAAANISTDNATITLLKDCGTSNQLNIINAENKGDVTLDLNAKLLSITSSTSNTAITGIYVSGRKLTIVSSNDSDSHGSISTSSKGKIIELFNGTLTIEKGNLVSTSSDSYTYVVLLGGTSSSMTMTSGKIESENIGIYVQNGSTLAIGGGEIVGNLRCIYNYGTANITGGTFSTKEKSIIITDGNSAETTVSGGYFSSDASNTSDLFTTNNNTTAKCYVIGGCFDRPINSDRTEYLEDEYANSLNLEEETKNKYPFIVVKSSHKFNVQKENSEKIYWHAIFSSTVKHANMAEYNTTITPTNNQTNLLKSTLKNTSHTITIDLNNYTISAKDETVAPFIDVQSTVVIKNGTIESQDTATVRVFNGNLEISNCRITSSLISFSDYFYYGGIVVNRMGTLNIENSTIYASTKNVSLVLGAGSSTTKRNSTRIKDCTIISAANGTTTSNSSPAVCQFRYGNTEIDGGYYYSKSTQGSRATINRASTSAETTLTATIIIRSGYFCNAATSGGLCLKSNWNANIAGYSIYGGYYSSDPSTSYSDYSPVMYGKKEEVEWSESVEVNNVPYQLSGRYIVSAQ